MVERFPEGPAVVDKAAHAVAGARAAGVGVMHVQVGFRPGHPEVSPRNKMFSAIAGAGRMVPGDPGSELHPGLTRLADEPVVTKRRVSAFAGSDLEVLLRAAAIEHLVLCGISTSGVVLSTLRQAVDMDYACTVLTDACTDDDTGLHTTLLEKLFPRQATVVSVEEWLGSLHP